VSGRGKGLFFKRVVSYSHIPYTREKNAKRKKVRENFKNKKKSSRRDSLKKRKNEGKILLLFLV
jgi:hypothetical protein